MSLLKSSFTIASFTLLSRIFGFVRDMLFASVVGTGILADAFVVAFRFPNMFRALFAEGAMNAVFVPIFSKLLKDKQGAKQFAQSLGVLISGFILCFVAIGIMLMPYIMGVQASGYVNNPEKFLLTVDLAQIMFPYLLFMVMTSFFAGILNSFEQFALPAFSPMILNIVLIAILLASKFNIVPISGYGLAWGVIIAGVLQAGVLLYGCVRYGIFPFAVRIVISPQITQFFRKVVPVTFGASVLQLNILVGTILATTLESGSVSFLYYADRLVQLPLGVIGIAISIALIPMLSKSIADNDVKKSQSVQSQALVFSLFLTIPASVALAVMHVPIISALFGYGVFTFVDTLKTASALQVMALGLPAFVLVKVLTPAYFARMDTKTPVKIAVFCMGVNIGLSLVFMQTLSFVGLALATTISAWCNVGLLIYILYRRRIIICENISRSVYKILLSSAIMGAVLYGVYTQYGYVIPYTSSYKIWALIFIIILGKVVYGCAVYITNPICLDDIKSALRK